MSTRQRVTRSSLGTPNNVETGTVLNASVESKPMSTPSPTIPRGLMTRDGTPVSSTARLNSDLRLNPLRLPPTSRSGTRSNQPVVPNVTRGGAAKRQFKPKLPAISDRKKDGLDIQAQIVDAPKDEAKRKSPNKKHSATNNRNQKQQLIQLESSVFTGSPGLRKPIRASKTSSSPSFRASTLDRSEKVENAKCDVVKKDFSKLDGYESDNFVVSDEEEFDDDIRPRKKYSTVKPIGYECLHNQNMKKRVKVEKSETEFQEKFRTSPASDVLMKFLSLHKVNLTGRMMLMQVPQEFLTTEKIQIHTGEDSQGSLETVDNFVGKLRMYESGRIEILKPDGTSYEITRTGSEPIHVPPALPKISFPKMDGSFVEYPKPNTVDDQKDRKHQVAKLDLEYKTVEDDPDSKPELIGGTVIEVAELDPNENLIVIPSLIGESLACDEIMECEADGNS